MQGVLQSSAFACRGSVLQPAHQAPSQRSPLLDSFHLWFIWWISIHPLWTLPRRLRPTQVSARLSSEICHEWERWENNPANYFCALQTWMFFRWDASGNSILFLKLYCSLFPGPFFFMGCFSFAVGMALLYYYSGTVAFYLSCVTWCVTLHPCVDVVHK